MADKGASTVALAAIETKSDTGRQVAMGCGGCLTLIVVAFASLMIGGQLLGTLIAKPGIAILSAFLAIVICVPYAALFVWIDRNEKEPFLLLVGTFLWGAVTATGLSLVFNESFSSVAMAILNDPTAARQATASISAPFFEEITKALALGVIFLAFPRHFDNVLDGVVYGAMAGLGFATVENYMYYVSQPTVGGVFGVFWIRGVVAAIGSHAVYTAITGVGLGAFRVLRSGAVRWLLPPLALGLAMFVHFMWNTFTQYFLLGASGIEALFIRLPLAALILHVPFTIAILGTAGIALWHEAKLIRTYLGDEAPNIVRPDDMSRLLPARRRASKSAGLILTGKFGEYWKVRKRNELLVRLAFEKWHMRAEAKHKDQDAAQQHAVSVLEIRQKLMNS